MIIYRYFWLKENAGKRDYRGVETLSNPDPCIYVLFSAS
jgi:hypothetical protein